MKNNTTLTAIVTGATKGIGRAIAFELAGKGYSLALSARSVDDLGKLKSDLTELYPRQTVLIKPCDFSIKKQIDEFSDFVKATFKQLDVIVNNVGIYHESTISEDKDGVMENLMNTNVYSAYHLTRHFTDMMKAKKSGHIFNICSVTSLSPRTTAAAYSITKSALLSFSRALSNEMSEYNIKVTSIIPGSVNTSSWDNIPAAKEQFVQPKDISKMISACLNMSQYTLIDEIVIRPLHS